MNTQSRRKAKQRQAAKLSEQKKAEPEKDPLDDERELRLKYLPFLVPNDENDIEEAKRVDKENARRYAVNKQHETDIQTLLKNMNLPVQRVPHPSPYEENARARFSKHIRRPEVKSLLAVEWLATNRKQYPVKDYAVKEAADMADAESAYDYVHEYRRQHPLISLENVPGATSEHARMCGCNLRWDGESETCNQPKGKRGVQPLRVRWMQKKEHHFLDPHVEPQIY